MVQPIKFVIERAVVHDNDTGEDTVLSKVTKVIEGDHGEIIETVTMNSFLTDGQSIRTVEAVGPVCCSCNNRIAAKGVKRCARCDRALCRFHRVLVGKKVYCRSCALWIRIRHGVKWLLSPVGSRSEE